MTRAGIRRGIEAIGVVPVVRVGDARLALRAVEALIAGGIALAEITLTVPNALALIRELTEHYGGRASIGAGTVTSVEQARAAIDAGAQFVVSPGCDADIVAVAHARDVLAIPGVLTPTEVMAALRTGAELVKIFPCAAVGGARYLRALRGPFPELRMLPTGGVSLESVPDYIAAGAAALGVGSELVAEAELASGDSASLCARARAFAMAVVAARSHAPAPDTNSSAALAAGALTHNPRTGV